MATLSSVHYNSSGHSIPCVLPSDSRVVRCIVVRVEPRGGVDSTTRVLGVLGEVEVDESRTFRGCRALSDTLCLFVLEELAPMSLVFDHKTYVSQPRVNLGGRFSLISLLPTFSLPAGAVHPLQSSLW